MINNDVLRAVRYMLDLSDGKVVELIQLADATCQVGRDEVRALLLRDDEAGYVECADPLLARFLDGLIVYRRGRDQTRPARPPAERITNNLVLKKLRVAFALKDVDMHETLALAGFPMSKPELSALFRQRDHKNFRPCGDQLLRHFLKGLTLRLRGGD